MGPAERSHYDDVAGANLRAVLALVAPGDVVVVHDPQPLGLVPGLVAAGATVVWTCHVGIDMPNEVTRSAWDFLRADVLAAHAAAFTRAAYAWEGLDADRVHVIPPCIDDASRKNVALDPEHVESIVRRRASWIIVRRVPRRSSAKTAPPARSWSGPRSPRCARRLPMLHWWCRCRGGMR